LAGPAGQLLGGTPDDLTEDHARVAPRTHQGGASEGIDELGPPHLIDQLAIQTVELVAHRAQRERHVVPGVPVRDREDVQVVYLLWPLVQVRGGGPNDARESLYRGPAHAGVGGALIT